MYTAFLAAVARSFFWLNTSLSLMRGILQNYTNRIQLSLFRLTTECHHVEKSSYLNSWKRHSCPEVHFWFNVCFRGNRNLRYRRWMSRMAYRVLHRHLAIYFVIFYMEYIYSYINNFCTILSEHWRHRLAFRFIDRPSILSRIKLQLLIRFFYSIFFWLFIILDHSESAFPWRSYQRLSKSSKLPWLSFHQACSMKLYVVEDMRIV